MNCYGSYNKHYKNSCYMMPQMQEVHSCPMHMNPMQCTYPQQNMYPMQTMQDTDLECMYPELYHKVYPAVKNYCDMVGIKEGMMITPSKEQMDGMVDNIYMNVEPEIDMTETEMVEAEPARQLGFGVGSFGGRRFLRDIIGILLIRELLRRRYGYGYGGYFPGYLGY